MKRESERDRELLHGVIAHLPILLLAQVAPATPAHTPHPPFPVSTDLSPSRSLNCCTSRLSCCSRLRMRAVLLAWSISSSPPSHLHPLFSHLSPYGERLKYLDWIACITTPHTFFFSLVSRLLPFRRSLLSPLSSLLSSYSLRLIRHCAVAVSASLLLAAALASPRRACVQWESGDIGTSRAHCHDDAVQTSRHHRAGRGSRFR